MRYTQIFTSVALLGAVVLSGCKNDDQVAQAAARSNSYSTPIYRAPQLSLPSGTALDVTLNTAITSENAHVGDAWNGSIRNTAFVDGKSVIPVGSQANGTVSAVTPAAKGSRAMLDLALTSVTVGNRTYHVHGSTESVIAGSTRARNLGVIGGSAAAGALIGNKVGGSTKGTLIGAIVGGGVAAGVVSRTKGYQVELKQGMPFTFTTSEAVAVRP